MRLFPSDAYPLPLPTGHRFPLDKYRLLRERLEHERDRGMPFEFVQPHAATDEELLRVHDPLYLRRVFEGTLTDGEVRRIGFPWSAQLVERSRRSTGAAVDAARTACDEGIAASLAGGTHHAGIAFGEGYCLFNDTAVAARAMQADGKIRRVLILDLDVHQGNGTAEIFSGDETVFTCSVHGERNFPLRKVPGSLDIGLPDGDADEIYLEAVHLAVQESFARSGLDLVLFIAGVDPFEGDRLGRLAVSRAGLAERDRIVFEAVIRTGVPLVIVCGGGYADDPAVVADLHAATMIAAAKCLGVSGRSTGGGDPRDGPAGTR